MQATRSLLTSDIEDWGPRVLRPAYQLRDDVLHAAYETSSTEETWERFVSRGLLPSSWDAHEPLFAPVTLQCGKCRAVCVVLPSQGQVQCVRCKLGGASWVERPIPFSPRDCVTVAAGLPLLVTAQQLLYELRSRVCAWGVPLQHASIVWRLTDDPLGSMHQYSEWHSMLGETLRTLPEISHPDFQLRKSLFTRLFLRVVGYHTMHLIGAELMSYEYVEKNLSARVPSVSTNPFEPLVALWKLGFRAACVGQERIILVIPSAISARDFSAKRTAGEVGPLGWKP